jgi:PAS domain S-box-containing protein
MTTHGQKSQDTSRHIVGSRQELRQRAEDLALSMRSEESTPLSLEEASRLVHELRVHQFELEMQNEQLRRTELEVEVARARYFDLYDLAPVGYVTLDEQGMVLEANLSVATLLHTSRGALVNRPLMLFIVAEDRGRYFRFWHELLEARTLGSLESRMVRTDGVSFWARLQATVAQDEQSSLSVCRITISDVNDRRQAEERLADSEARFRTIFDRVTDGVLLADLENQRFVITNRAIREMLGYAEQQLLELRPSDIHPEEQLAAVAKLFSKQARDQLPVVHDVPVQRANGSVFFADVSAAPITLDGRALVMRTFRDATERRSLQASVAQADRMASMGVLAAGVAHEINNPLAYTLYNLESLTEDVAAHADALRHCRSLLADRIGEEDFASLLGPHANTFNPGLLEDMLSRYREALEGANRVKEIVKALSTFSHVEQHRIVPVDLRHIVETAINMVYNEIKFRARLVKDFDQVPAVMANDARLSQVFLNLLVNAAQAIPEGEVSHNEIRIRIWQEQDEARVEVSDTGTGIAASDMGRIFEPFFTTKAVGVGTGLGLSICSNIITGYGGRIEVSSRPAQGTSFVVHLPFGKTEEATPVAVQPRAASSIPFVRGRILVVDDEPTIRAVARRMLEGQHEVVEADSGRAAMDRLGGDPRFDLILCDVMMPDISGLDLHAWLCEKHPRLAGQVVFITGGVFTPRATEYLARVKNVRVEKPFDSNSLKKMVSELVIAAQGKE